MIVTIPGRRVHEGLSMNLITIEISDTCPVCADPRGEIFETHSFDGSRRLNCDGWKNPCGHVDTYAAVREEYKNALERTKSVII